MSKPLHEALGLVEVWVKEGLDGPDSTEAILARAARRLAKWIDLTKAKAEAIEGRCRIKNCDEQMLLAEKARKSAETEIVRLRAVVVRVEALAGVWENKPGLESFAPAFAEELRAALASPAAPEEGASHD